MLPTGQPINASSYAITLRPPDLSSFRCPRRQSLCLRYYCRENRLTTPAATCFQSLALAGMAELSDQPRLLELATGAKDLAHEFSCW